MDKYKERIKLLLIIGIFFAPLLAAHWYFNHIQDGELTRTTNYGAWVKPIPVAAVPDWHDVNDKVVAKNYFNGRWTLVLTARDNCADDCRQLAILLRQVWILLNKDAGRVQRLLLANDLSGPETAEFLAALGDATVVKTGDVTAAGFPVGLPLLAFIVDPHGNVILQYPPPIDPKRFLEDLRRLLKASQIG